MGIALAIPTFFNLLVRKFVPYNFKNFNAFEIERILQKTALFREVADVGEAVPSLTDAGGCLYLYIAYGLNPHPKI